jgi:F0F1-type ATP synthase membrane subunit b/b'
MVNAKHLATFIMGAAAGVALHKYLQTEEGEQMLEDLKTKAGDLKNEAEGALDKMPEYFEQLKTQGSEMLNKYTPEAEKMLQELLETLQGKKPETPAA